MSDFINNIKKVSGNREHSIKNSYGVTSYYDYYKFNYIKGNPKKYNISLPLFRKLLREINKHIVNTTLSKGYDLKLPLRFGILELIRFESYPKIKDNKLVYKAPICWGDTLKLWEIDEEARKSKLLLRSSQRAFVKVRYNKSCAYYKNKTYIYFKINRQLRKDIFKDFTDNKIIIANGKGS